MDKMKPEEADKTEYTLGHDVIVCRCEEITAGEIYKAIEAGACTVDGVKRMTRAGMGTCQGRTCSAIIAGMLFELKGGKMEDYNPFKTRMPARPMGLDVLALEGERLFGKKA